MLNKLKIIIIIVIIIKIITEIKYKQIINKQTTYTDFLNKKEIKNISISSKMLTKLLQQQQ